MAFARTQHHPLLAEANRPLVPICGDMPDGEYRHCNPAIDLCSACILCAKSKTGHVNNDPWLNETGLQMNGARPSGKPC